MDLEILDELEKIYRNFKIDVEFIDFRKYKIILEIEEKICEFEYIWNVNFTKDYNISIICYNIDKQIIKYYKKEDRRNVNNDND